MNKGQGVLYFDIQNTSFGIQASIQKDVLTIRLKDYVDWIIYEKEFTQANIGEQIHRKVDLIDLYNSIAFADNQADEQVCSSMETKMANYSMGETIKHGGIPSFKVQKGGRLTVYVSVMDLKTKKENVYESRLRLQKKRSFTELEVMTKSILMQKKKVQERLEKEIQTLKQENIILKQRLCRIEEKNTQYQRKQSNLLGQFSQIKKKLMQAQEKFEDSQRRIQKQLSVIGELERRIFIIQGRRKKSTDFYELNQANLNKFNIKNNIVQYVGKEVGSYTNFIFNQRIQQQGHKFSIKITKSTSNVIFIGVLDYSKQKDSRSSYSSGNAVCYQGCNGYKCPPKICQGLGFKQGQTIQVTVSLRDKKVSWNVGGQNRAVIESNILGDKQRTFMPYVEIRDCGDKVQLLD